MEIEAINKIAELSNIENVKIHEHGKCDPYFVLPKGVSIVNAEPYLPAPIRIKEVVTLSTLSSFAAYVNEYKADETKLFVSETDGGGKVTFWSYFNYHTKDLPSWKGHRAGLSFMYDDDFIIWKNNQKEYFPQKQFAEFIQEQIHNVVHPNAAELLEMCLTLQGKSELTFGGAHRLDNGQVKFSYEENIEMKGGGKGSITIPEVLTLSFPFYRHSEAIEVNAQLRYRINKDNGAISFCYIIPAMNKLLQEANDKLVAQVEKEVKITPLWGSI